MLNKNVLLVLIVLFISSFTWAQDFGFGFSEDNESQSAAGSSNAPSVNISGEVSAAIIGYIDEMREGAEAINTIDMFMFSGRLNFFAKSNFAEGIINLKLVPALVPVSIDEAYIRAFFGNLEFTAGLRKIAWGKADQFGPLDVINLPDQSRIFVEMADNTSLMGIKIANPVIHASYRFGQFSKLEGIFLPSFEIVSMAITTAVSPPDPLMTAIIGPASGDRWMPNQMKMFGSLISGFLEANPEINVKKNILPDTSGLDYAQAGLRFTTSLGSADVGLQYFYGRMFQPAVIMTYDFLTDPAAPTIDSIKFSFNNYHQIGIDYAQVLGGFSIRAEVAANITEDLKGDDGHVFNPSIGWSFGFDRDIIAGFNINIQANGNVRLFNDKVGSGNLFDPNFDNEGGKSMTATRITAMLSKKFLRDQLELRTAVVWGIEDEDAAIIPALIWTRDELRLALSGGFFLGNSEGQIGQYSGNNFLKLSVTYVF